MIVKDAISLRRIIQEVMMDSTHAIYEDNDGVPHAAASAPYNLTSDAEVAPLRVEAVRALSAASCVREARWPSIHTVGLTPTALHLRRSGIGGSDANIILSGDAARVCALWREKRGEGVPDDLSGVLPVMLGQWTEAFNRQWFERMSGFAVTDEGAVWSCLTNPWRRATLDGVVEDRRAIFEAKHVTAFGRSDEIVARYMPQLQHNMAVTGFENAILSVIYGNHKWETYEIAFDWLYQDELFAAEERFWRCVQSGDLPVALEPPPPPKPIAYRELCLDGNNAWAVSAGAWAENVEAAKLYGETVKDLKALIPDDVSRAFGHGLEAKRSKSGAISFRGMVA